MKVVITDIVGTRHVHETETPEDAIKFVNLFLKLNMFPENVRRITITDSSSKVLAAWEGGSRIL